MQQALSDNKYEPILLNFFNLVTLFWQIAVDFNNSHHDKLNSSAIAHADIKPGNIVVNLDDDNLDARFIDYAMSKTAPDNPMEFELQSSRGTPAYIPPECLVPESQFAHQKGCRGYYSIKSDIYSLSSVVASLFGAEDPTSDKVKNSNSHSSHSNSLLRILRTEYNYNGMLDKINNIPTSYLDIEQSVIKFVKRMGDQDATKRPDADELLHFTTALNNLCLLKKNNIEDEDKEKELCNKLELLENGLWNLFNRNEKFQRLWSDDFHFRKSIIKLREEYKIYDTVLKFLLTRIKDDNLGKTIFAENSKFEQDLLSLNKVASHYSNYLFILDDKFKISQEINTWSREKAYYTLLYLNAHAASFKKLYGNEQYNKVCKIISTTLLRAVDNYWEKRQWELPLTCFGDKQKQKHKAVNLLKHTINNMDDAWKFYFNDNMIAKKATAEGRLSKAAKPLIKTLKQSRVGKIVAAIRHLMTLDDNACTETLKQWYANKAFDLRYMLLYLNAHYEKVQDFCNIDHKQLDKMKSLMADVLLKDIDNYINKKIQQYNQASQANPSITSDTYYSGWGKAWGGQSVGTKINAALLLKDIYQNLNRDNIHRFFTDKHTKQALTRSELGKTAKELVNILEDNADAIKRAAPARVS